MSAGWIAADWPVPPNVIAGTTTRDSRYELPAEPEWLNQVHGARVVHSRSDEFADGKPEADAIIADYTGAICAVRTADCLPVLFCSENGDEIAAVHAGWRGLAAGIVEATITAMATSPGQILAWLGPAISQPAFEVGKEVLDAFLEADPAAAECFETNARGRWQADLYGLARLRLVKAGVTAVYGGGLCTCSDANRFFSFRRDGSTGRLISFVHRAR